MHAFTIRPLTTDTWDAFADLVERHHGIWGGCWCMWFHPKAARSDEGGEDNRARKQRLVEQDRAHAAIVFDGERAVGWCQFGSPDELPRIAHRKQYDAAYGEGLMTLPDYRLTCFFVDRAYRRKGVSAAALAGAVDLIAAAGGGVVEGYPHDTQGGRVSASFLHTGTRSMFEQAGFTYERPKGKNHCVMRTTVRGAA